MRDSTRDNLEDAAYEHLGKAATILDEAAALAERRPESATIDRLTRWATAHATVGAAYATLATAYDRD